MLDLSKLFKKKEAAKPKEVKRNSLFSTDIEFGETTPQSIQLSLEGIFQRTVEDFRPVNSDGTMVAMDAANQGNVGALKPVVQPFASVPFIQFQWYANQTFIGYQVAAIVAQHWLVDKACTMPGRDAMRHGYELTVNDGSDIEPAMMSKIRQLDKYYEIHKHAVSFVRFCRMFGIRIAVFKIESNDPKYYEKPFNPDGIKPGSYKGIVQVDPYWITPELSLEAAANPAAIDFYEPTWWRINSVRYHRSHLIVIKNGEVADILKPTYLYGGIPLPQKIAERVYAAERTANEAPMLAMTKRSTIWHMDMTKAVANQAAFESKMRWYSQMRDNYGVKAMGLDDVAEQFDTSLADLDAVIMTQYQIVAAIAEVPATKLLGTSPKGFNATGEFESDSYHEFLESIQTHDLQPLLERHYLILSRSEGFKIEIEIAWNPVDSPGAKEEAEINLIKAQTGNALATSGAIDGVDERARIIADKNSGYNGISDEVPEQIDADDKGDKEPNDGFAEND